MPEPLPEAAPLVTLQRVAMRFASGPPVLSELSLSLRRGEFVTLLGPSGCGKSSVLRLVAGLVRPSSGQVSAPALRPGDGSETAFVFQEPTLMPWASVFDNVWLPLRLQGQSRARAAPLVQQVLARVGLADRAAAYPAQLSGGMKMRASIARALVTRPQLLLMDEPFAALDDITRQALNSDLLAWWQAQTMAALFVTHSVAEAVFLSQRVLVMAANPGRLVAELTIAEAYPRRPDFRHSDSFTATCRQLSHALALAHADQPAAASSDQASAASRAAAAGTGGAR
jgi:NitT/TauT family transport system ATP-binding protein